MNKQKIILALVIFAIASTVIIFFVLPAKLDGAIVINQTGRLTAKNNEQLEKMADTINKYLDTFFFAGYRTKSGRYYFNYQVGRESDSPFTPSEFVESRAFELPKQLGVNYIWRNPQDNYLVFQILDNKKKNIIVLDTGQDTIKSTTLGNIPIDSFDTNAEIMIGRYKSITHDGGRIYIVSSLLEKYTD